MFKLFKRMCKKFMDNEELRYSFYENRIEDVKNISDDTKIGVGISIIGTGISIGLGFIVTAILNKKNNKF